MKTRRLFFGLATDAGLQRRITAFVQPLRALPALRDARWSHPSLYHITVRFIGETPEDHLAALATCGERAAAAVAPFQLTLTEVGMFARSRVLWLGLRDDEGMRALRRLHQALSEALAVAGLAQPEGRPYQPHLTLAREIRVRSLDAVPARLRTFPGAGAGWPVPGLVLFESVRTPEGLRYPQLASWALGGPGTDDARA
ncbi:MAG: RNA 2',3'-cyclic phosphodiesterase [Thermoflavifilum sp.]|nr:RNA 2',3'-cyclic phosphodiesterase [Thermoflavifilum sp.]MCL6514423.1 RNA 2',3'-cyclic phosphodiesterase [Alicyclobacillus sp.]